MSFLASKKLGVSLLLICLCTWLLCPTATAQSYDDTYFAQNSLEEIMESFRAQYGLTESNFSLCYYNTVTGESYTFADDHFMVAASTFKLPLNLYYYEMEQSGEIASDAPIPNSGTTLDQCHYQSLVWSNNEVSLAMLYNLGTFRQYKEKMCTYFSMAQEDIDYVYWVDNYYCTQMMMDTLKYLYDRQDTFSQMIDYLKQAQPGEYFKAYVSDYEIAHKYGYFEGAINDVGIIYTPQPYLLACYTQDVADGAQVVGKVNELLCAYTVWHGKMDEQAAQLEETVNKEEENSSSQISQMEETDSQTSPSLSEETNPPTPTPQQETTSATENQTAPSAQTDISSSETGSSNSSEPQPNDTSAATSQSYLEENLWWMLLVAFGIFLFGGLGIRIAFKLGKGSRNYRGKYLPKK